MKDNKLIAEFMGWDIKSLTTLPINLHLSNLELDGDEVLEYKYHTSWDWLIPVVRKIAEDFNVVIYDNDEIEKVHKRVVEFIRFIKTKEFNANNY